VIKKNLNSSEGIRLNRYIALCGVCSRRKADDLIKAGAIKVNDEIITDFSYRVKPNDKVYFNGKIIRPISYVYILLNKPKDVITTTSDEKGRTTIVDLISAEIKQRVFPVGRLDRNTTGLILLTNDGFIAKKLMHPSHKIKKVYEVTLNKILHEGDLEKIRKGLEIDGRKVYVDDISYQKGKPRNVVGVELHVGMNHVVKKIFEAIGYKVIKLDRTLFGPFTKKNLPRGKWRFLTPEEIKMLYRL
jgi:23S rRNA pseudouridine2605 synthase